MVKDTFGKKDECHIQCKEFNNSEMKNLMEENKFLKQELSKRKEETMKLQKNNSTCEAMSDEQSKLLNKEMDLVRQMYCIDLEHFGENPEDVILVPSFFEEVASKIKENVHY